MKGIQKYFWNNNEETENIKIDPANIPQARDILNHFNKNIYPDIKKKYESMLNPTKRTFLELFGKKLESESDIYKKRGTESATKMTEFIIGTDTQNIIRIKLLLETIRLEMDRAYGNVLLDYTHAAEKYEEQEQPDKAKIIKHCLKILSDRFRDKVATISFEWDYIIIETRKEKTLVHKDDFLKKN